MFDKSAQVALIMVGLNSFYSFFKEKKDDRQKDVQKLITKMDKDIKKELDLKRKRLTLKLTELQNQIDGLAARL